MCPSGLYERYILSRLIDWSCGSRAIGRGRLKIVPEAEGVVVDVGFGSGTNLPYYDPNKISRLIAVEPSDALRHRAAGRLARFPHAVDMVETGAEAMPLPNALADTAVLTFSLCTIPDWRRALSEIRRVLKPTGKLIVFEHGRAPDEGVARFQDRLDPLWNRVAGGCHLNRPISAMLEESGFETGDLISYYDKGTPRFAGFMFRGVVRPR